MTNQIKSEQMMQNMMVMTSCAYLRNGANGSVTNVNNYEAKDQQAYSPAHSMSPVTPVSTSVPPPPPPAAGSPAQYPRYTVNADQLKAMAKKLRKPNKDNISKIPKRQDMKIPSKDTKTVEREAPLPPPAPPLPSLAPEELLEVSLERPETPKELLEVSIERPEPPEELFEVSLERPEPPEFPSTLLTPKAFVESLAPLPSCDMDETLS